jgi:hypothetical protein
LSYLSVSFGLVYFYFLGLAAYTLVFTGSFLGTGYFFLGGSGFYFFLAGFFLAFFSS